MQSFDIYFSGALMQDASPEQARAAVGKMFKLEGKKLEHLFSGRPVCIKKAVSVEKANKYRAAFREAGALVDIVLHGQQPPVKKKPADSDKKAASAPLTMFPPGTGSLEDFSISQPPIDIPDINWIELNERGTLLDQTPAPTPLVIDTSALSSDQASLKAFSVYKQPVDLPSIAHLKLVDD